MNSSETCANLRLYCHDVGMFIGRAAQLSSLAAAITARRSAVITGEAGVGKTTLVREATARSGARVLTGGALSTLSWRQYLAFERALGRAVRGRDAAAVADDIAAATRGSVLVLEDLQWAADATIDVVGALVGQRPSAEPDPERGPACLLATVRTGDESAARLIERLRQAGLAEIDVGPLPDPSAAELVRSLHPALAPDGVVAVLRRAGGNPLLLSELAPDGSASGGLRRAVGARLRSLDPAARRAFLLLALAGRPLDEDVLDPIAIKNLHTAGLVVGHPDGTIEARHALLSEIAAEDAAADLVAEVHDQLAALIDDPGESARHLALAGRPADACERALLAAEAATMPGERARHLRLAAATSSGPADELRLQAARALAEAYDWTGVEEVLDDLSESASDHVIAEACLLRARGAWGRGAPEMVRPMIADGLAHCSPGSDQHALLTIESCRVPLFVERDLTAAVGAAERAVAAARAAGVGRARADYFLGTALSVVDAPGAEERLAAAIDSARQERDLDTEMSAANNLVSHLESAGSQVAALELADRMAVRAHELGLGFWENSMRSEALQLAFHLGRLDDVMALGEDLRRRPLDVRSRDQLREVMAMTLVDLGRTEEAEELGRRWGAEAVPDTRGALQFVWVRAEAALWGGRPAEALARADEYLAEPDENPNLVLGRVTRAWACLLLDRDPGAPAEVGPTPFLQAVPHELSAIRLLHRGRAAEAAAEFATARESWSGYHVRGELRTAWAHGESLRRAGDPEAIPVLIAVERRAERSGFGPIAARAKRSLRQTGLRRSARRGTTAFGLTVREDEILGLAAAGLSNAEIAERLGLSRRTVVTEVEAATRRLQATGRTQAVAIWRAGQRSDR